MYTIIMYFFNFLFNTNNNNHINVKCIGTYNIIIIYYPIILYPMYLVNVF